MMIQNITNSQNFEGKFVIVNNLSNKPARCAKAVKGDIEKLIRYKDFNINLRQDYLKHEIALNAEYPFPLKSNRKLTITRGNDVRIPITSKSSRYIEAAKDAIDLFEKDGYKAEQIQYEEQQKNKIIENLQEIAGTIIYVPLFIISDILHDIKPKTGKKFEDFIYKFI